MEHTGQHWEYLTQTTMVELNDERLNAWGSAGWELVSAVPMRNGQVYYVFKCPALSAAPDGRGTGRPPVGSAIPPRGGA